MAHFSTETADPGSWPTGGSIYLQPGQLAGLDHTPASAFRKQILLDWASPQLPSGFDFDPKVCVPERAAPEATGALGAESGAAYFSVWAFLLSAEISVTLSEMYKTVALCVAVAIWPKRLSPRTRLATSPAGVCSQDWETQMLLQPDQLGWGPCLCAPLSPPKIRGAEESPGGPSRSFPCSWFLWKFFQRLVAGRLTAREEHYPHASCLWRASEAWNGAMWQNCSARAMPGRFL